MQEALLKILDVFFFGFHTILILFNVFGWLIPRWRFINFISLSLTTFSWFILGIWFGWGYCICTDWHWQVREILGYQNKSTSYIHFLLLKLTNVNLSTELVDICTIVIFFSALIVSTCLNVKKWLLNKNATKDKIS